MGSGKWLRYCVAGLVLLLGMGFWGCDSDDDGGGGNPDVPAGVNTSDNSEMFLWKLQPSGQAGCPGPRAVARWPSYMVRTYGVTPDNSYVVAGNVRMDFYKMDTDFNGSKPSYAACVSGPADFATNQKVVLYKNGKRLAYAIVPNPGERYFAPLP